MDHASPLLQTFVYLAAALLTVPLAKRLGLGSVPGYVIAGALIGPSALGLLGEPEEVMHVAEFGVVIMLFLIGLEMRPELLWRMRASILGLGGAQLALTGAALAGIGLVAGLDWRAALACGVILAISSTAIAMQSLRERGLAASEPGRAAFAVLLFQDVAVIPLLALLPLLAVAAPAQAEHGALGHLPAWAQALATVGAVALVVAAGRLLTRPLFRMIAETDLREMFTAAALAIVVGVAVLMQTVGLSPALGAFVAGVVLADSEFRHELESDIEPFRGLLLGLFFITVGASVDFALLAREPVLVAGAVAGLLAVKTAIMVGLGRAFGLKPPDAILAGLAVSQGGEFAFVLLGMAAGLGVTDRASADLLIAVVALSMAATPLMFLLGRRFAGAAAAPPESREEEIETDRPHALIAGFGRFGQIVGRLLTVSGFRTSVLEHSAAQIDLLRSFGNRVNYGDASRVELMRAAGAGEAQILVIAVDDQAKAIEIAERAREHFPHLRILARAYDRRHAFELLRLDVDVIERETFEGGVRMGVEALKQLGFRAHQAERAGRLFRRHDLRLFREMAEFFGDDATFRAETRIRSALVNEVMRRDIAVPSAPGADTAWDTESLDAETRASAPAPTAAPARAPEA